MDHSKEENQIMRLNVEIRIWGTLSHLDGNRAHLFPFLDMIETFILFDGGDRKQLCDEIWDEAKYHIKNNWRDGTHDALNELRTGELYGLGYGTGRGAIKNLASLWVDTGSLNWFGSS